MTNETIVRKELCDSFISTDFKTFEVDGASILVDETSIGVDITINNEPYQLTITMRKA